MTLAERKLTYYCSHENSVDTQTLILPTLVKILDPPKSSQLKSCRSSPCHADRHLDIAGMVTDIILHYITPILMWCFVYVHLMVQINKKERLNNYVPKAP